MVLGLFMVSALTLGSYGVLNAATYQYINTQGQLESISADSATEALRTASNLGSHSGVILASNATVEVTTVPNGSGSNWYMYVNDSGTVITISANSPAEAFSKAINLATHSGVMLINSSSDQGVVGDSVPLPSN